MPVRASTVPPNSSLDHSVVGKGFLSPLLSHNRAGGQTNIKGRAYFLSRAAPFPTILHRVEKQNEKKAAQTPHQNYRHRDNRQGGREVESTIRGLQSLPHLCCTTHFSRVPKITRRKGSMPWAKIVSRIFQACHCFLGTGDANHASVKLKKVCPHHSPLYCRHHSLSAVTALGQHIYRKGTVRPMQLFNSITVPRSQSTSDIVIWLQTGKCACKYRRP